MPSAYEVTPWGAGLTALYAPLKAGEKEPFNILLSFPEPKMFETVSHPYLHQTIGRTTNRIEGAQLTDLNGRDYKITANEGSNTLHGGIKGWNAHHWADGGVVKRAYESSSGDTISWVGDDKGNGQRDARAFTLRSPDGDQGFPGEVEGRCWYSEGKGAQGENVVEIEWEAELVGDGGNEALETVVGMTNHAYFNLNPAERPSEKTLTNHTARLATSRYLQLAADKPGIPTGEFALYPGIPKVPYASFPLDEEGEVLAIDDCFVIDEEPSKIPTDTRRWPLQTVAELHGSESGIRLIVESTEPAFQFYTGEYIQVPGWEAGQDGDKKWEAGDGYRAFSAVAIEPSKYVNAAGRKEWRGMVLVKKGQVFGAKARYIISRT